MFLFLLNIIANIITSYTPHISTAVFSHLINFLIYLSSFNSFCNSIS